MFEEEIELEKKEGSGFGPLIIILLMVGLFIGGIVVVIRQNTLTMTADEARAELAAKIQKEEPVTFVFHTGEVPYSAKDKPSDPQYALLEKAGLIKRGKAGGVVWAAKVELTPAGKKWVEEVPGVRQSKEDDGTVGYVVPLASKKLVSVDKVTKLSMKKFEVQYSWDWKTTKAGDLFDVAGTAVQGLPQYERGMLIDEHGAGYYHAAPMQAKVALMKDTDHKVGRY